MPKKQKTIEIDGEITEALPNTTFRAKVNEDAEEEWRGKELLCTLSGKMRMYRIRVIPGDKVKIQVTPYDETKGRIIYRYK